ncbi:MAG: FAD-dependent oxidoreductase [Planctomycetota bacterium]
MPEARSEYRVAVVGSGPAAFYAAEALFKSDIAGARVDLFDRLPAPFGLVRGGVAPDHQKIKGVTRVYDKIAANDGFRFFGNVKLGRDLTVDDLATRYHHVVYAFGCESDNRLGLDGEDLDGVYAATDFVGWYNGHPDHRQHRFDLARAKRVALVGNGNVAMDVARILLEDPDVLAETDIADHALATLRTSAVEEVVLLGRRGPAQAAFSPKEIEEIHAIDGVDVVVRPADGELDALSAAWLEEEGARSQRRNVKFLQERAAAAESAVDRKKLRCRFLVAPTALHGADGKLTAVTIGHMQLRADDAGTPRPRATGAEEQLDVDLVFKAIGYRGEPVPGVPFEERQGIVPNVDGRVVEHPGGDVRPGHYCAGWCKRGPTGLIGTNSLDAKETVAAMLEDLRAGRTLQPTGGDVVALLRERGVDAVSWSDWQRLDTWELEQGAQRGKLRHKLASVEELMTVVRELRPR